MQFKIFISYSSNDLDQVELLRLQLSDTPIEIFIAEHSVMPSEDLSSKITRGISDCDLFVVLWSSNAENSKWVSQEIGHAKALNKTILPLVLHEGLSLPGFISTLKYLPVYPNPKSALKGAREIILKSYNGKAQKLAEQEEKKQKELFLVGAGALLLWAFSK